jgi:hypothetical protein
MPWGNRRVALKYNQRRREMPSASLIISAPSLQWLMTEQDISVVTGLPFCKLSVQISPSRATGYRPDERWPEFLTRQGQHLSYFYVVQTRSGIHPASCPMVQRTHSPGLKRPGVKLTTHLKLVQKSNIRGPTIYSPKCCQVVILNWLSAGAALLFLQRITNVYLVPFL